MNETVLTPKISFDEVCNILYVDFVGHITKHEMVEMIDQMNTLLSMFPKRPVKALHNLTEATHISIDAQVIFSEYSQLPFFKKHAFVSGTQIIIETIDIIITVSEQNTDSMRIFDDAKDAVRWLIE